MAISFATFVNTYNGTAHDVDGMLGAQCVDGANFYLLTLGYGTIGGNACDFYYNRYSNGILNYCNIVSGSPQNGDIAVWLNVSGGYGHVAMYCDGYYFGQNQGDGANLTTGKAYSIDPVGQWPGFGTPAIFFRPKCYANGSGGGTINLPGPPIDPPKPKLHMEIVNGFVVRVWEE